MGAYSKVQNITNIMRDAESNRVKSSFQREKVINFISFQTCAIHWNESLDRHDTSIRPVTFEFLSKTRRKSLVTFWKSV